MTMLNITRDMLDHRGMIEIQELASKKLLRRFPVDAREMIASGDYASTHTLLTPDALDAPAPDMTQEKREVELAAMHKSDLDRLGAKYSLRGSSKADLIARILKLEYTPKEA